MLVTLCAVVGLAVGSFLNVVIARVPDGESVVRPGSRCPACGTPVAPRDNVPVLGWLLLRGRARCCGAPIPPWYPLVEASTAVAFGAVAAWTGPAVVLPAMLHLAAVSIALAVIDLQVFRLPFAIVTPSYVVAAVLLGTDLAVSRDGEGALRMLLAALACRGFYWVLHMIKPNAMGYGDVHLAGMLGLYLGWAGWEQTVVGLFAGFFTGGIVGLVLLAAGLRKVGSHLPYGPYLLVGAWIGLVAGAPVADWYLGAAGL